MNALQRFGLVQCVAGALLIGCSAFARAESAAAPPTEPAFKPGDTLTVASQHASLRIGENVVATLPRGHRVLVAEVRDRWVGTLASVDGQPKAGWIQTHEFLPADTPAVPCTALLSSTGTAQVHTAYRLSESGAPTPVAVGREVSTAYRFDHHDRDPFVTGRYERHETDPNMHVWEPWRR